MNSLTLGKIRRLILLVCLTFSVSSRGATETLVITGSDTMAGLLTAWSVAFVEDSPNTVVEIQAAGSAAAPTALAAGTASLGAMSRSMSTEELQRFQRQRGYLPTVIPVARDALAIIVHPTNPITSLSLTELDGIFSGTLNCGGKAYRDWRDLLNQNEQTALALPLIEAYGRTSISGSYGFFKDNALCQGDYATHVVSLPGFAAIVDSVAAVERAIGYASLGYVTPKVKVIPIRGSDGSLSSANAAMGETYPLGRTLYLYLSIPPNTAPSRAVCEFLRFVTQPVAHNILKAEGFSPAQGLTSVVHTEVSRVCG